MTALVQELLNTFDSLTDSEQREIALEIFKRVTNSDFPPLSDDELVLNAEALFLELDQREGNNE